MNYKNIVPTPESLELIENHRKMMEKLAAQQAKFKEQIRNFGSPESDEERIAREDAAADKAAKSYPNGRPYWLEKED